MKIYKAKHFLERLEKRAHNIEEVMDIFHRGIKLVKKKKIRAIKAPLDEDKEYKNRKTAYKLRFESCTFVYTKHRGKYLLITFYQRGNSKKGWIN